MRSTQDSASAGPAAPLVVAPQDRGTSRFYATVAAVSAVVMVFGFAQTYYLKLMFGTPPLTVLVHVHGVVMTAWVLLFIVQTRLVAARRVDLHRKLGWLGLALALLVVATGFLTAVQAVRKGWMLGDLSPLVSLAFPLNLLVDFSLLFTAALWLRRRPEAHKRLMLLASIVLLVPVLERILPFPWPPVLTYLSMVLCAVYDTARHRRLHPAFGVGVPAVLFINFLWLALWAPSPTWTRVAVWLIG